MGKNHKGTRGKRLSSNMTNVSDSMLIPILKKPNFVDLKRGSHSHRILIGHSIH